MNDIILATIVFFGLFLSTNQLSCMTNCSVIQVKYPDSFIEPVNHRSCIVSAARKICKGQIVAYYNDKSYPKYINYTFGTIDDMAEKENENAVITHGLSNLTKYQLIVNAKSEETIIKADIYCKNSNQCILYEIKQLFVKYNNQINPYYELKSFIYVDPSPEKLVCYDRVKKESEQCSILYQNPVCISYLKDLRQECTRQSDIHIHEEFLITSPHTYELHRMTDLVICNKDNCNSNEILTKIQNIASDYAYGIVIRKNNGNRQRINQMFLYIIIQLYFFF